MSREFEKLFRQLNDSHFGGRLHPVAVHRKRLFSVRQYSSGAPIHLGAFDSNRNTIQIGVKNPRMARAILLHEMIHVKLYQTALRRAESTVEDWKGHGPRFRRELRRLAAMGERWAEKELNTTDEQEGDDDGDAL